MAVVIDTRNNGAGAATESKRRGGRPPGFTPTKTLDLVIAIEKRTGKTLRESVMTTLRETGSETVAAKRLGTTTVTLRKWMDRMGIKAKFRVEFVQE